MLKRTDILTRFPWLTQRQRHMIIGNDIDVRLSAQFLQHTHDYTTLYHDPAIDPRTGCGPILISVIRSAA